MQILLCGDDIEACWAPAILITMAGHGATQCHTPEDALKELQAAPFDAAVLDIDLPDMNGWALAGQVRKLSLRRRLRLVAHTGALRFATVSAPWIPASTFTWSSRYP